jgi:hypothetical protein
VAVAVTARSPTDHHIGNHTPHANLLLRESVFGIRVRQTGVSRRHLAAEAIVLLPLGRCSCQWHVHDKTVAGGPPPYGTPDGKTYALVQVAQAHSCRWLERGPGAEVIAHNQVASLSFDSHVEWRLPIEGIVFHSVLEQFLQDERRKMPVPRSCAINDVVESHRITKANLGQHSLPFEGGKLVSQRDQGSTSRIDHILIRRGQRLHECHRTLRIRFDQLKQAVQAVVQEMWISVSLKRIELRLKAGSFQSLPR